MQPFGTLAVYDQPLGRPACECKAMTEAAKKSDSSSGDDRSGLREGEIAVELPERFDAQLYYIGRIRTPWQTRDDCPKNGRETEEVCTIEFDLRWAKGLQTVRRAPRHVCVALAGAAESARATPLSCQNARKPQKFAPARSS